MGYLITRRLSFTFMLVGAFLLRTFGQLSEGGMPTGFKFANAANLTPVEMPAINRDSLLQDDAINEKYKDRPFRFGYNHFVNLNYNNSGAWTTLPNGDRLWQLDILARGAYSINVAFSDFVLPQGARLFVYSKDHQQVLGGFSSKNNTEDHFFGTELIYRDEVVIEYYEPAAVRGQGGFNLFRITQGYKDPKGYLKSFSQAGSCIPNINCPVCTPYALQKQGVVCIVTGGNELCSGSLVNNTRNDGTPYILTANHCAQGGSSGWVFRFNWEAPGCADPTTDPSTTQSISGCTLIANSGVSDFYLVKMSSAPPASFQPFYLGWNYSNIPATNVAVIHHPQGDIKKCSIADNPVTATAYDAGYGTAQVWKIGLYTVGATEPGSSGSPLLDQNNRIVGQLYGGTSDCGVPDSELTDYYGRFSVSWDSLGTPQTRLRDWLDPDSTNPVTNDGYLPYPPQATLNAALTSIISPGTASGCYSVTPEIAVENDGQDTIYSLTIQYHVDGNGDSVYQLSDTLAPFQSTTISLPLVNVAPGNHVFYAAITLVNGSANQNITNDTASVSFISASPATVPAPVIEGFEGGIFPPTGWAVTATASGSTWMADSVGGYGQSATSAAVDEFSPATSTVGERPTLITPTIDMTNVDTPAIMFFDVANARYNAQFCDSLAVLASADCGNTWTQLYGKGRQNLHTAPDDTANAFVPTPSEWRTDTINISQYAGAVAVEFEFMLISGYGNVTYLDNINIGETLTGIQKQIAGSVSATVFPNPFADGFTLRFTLQQSATINAGLYSMEGRLIASIMNNELINAGTQNLHISTAGLANGLYILKLNDQFLKLEKME